jgi:hypothetical protein
MTTPSVDEAWLTFRSIRLELAHERWSPAIPLGWRNEPDYASYMGYLLIADGSKYIDLSKADKFPGQGVTYYRSEHGVWVRQEGKNRLGEVVPQSEAFKGLLGAGLFDQAEKFFPELFEGGSKVEVPPEPNDKQPEKKKRPVLRITAGVLVGLLAGAYVTAVIAGAISANHQISVAGLGVIVIGLAAIGILVRPQLLSNVQIFELGTLKVQLRDLQGKQVDQKKELNELRFTLNLLVTEGERNHLENLDTGSTVGYQKSDVLQAELRRLRSLGLITSRHFISEMPNTFDLHEWGVELTPSGAEYLRRWKEASPSAGAS